MRAAPRAMLIMGVTGVWLGLVAFQGFLLVGGHLLRPSSQHVARALLQNRTVGLIALVALLGVAHLIVLHRRWPRHAVSVVLTEVALVAGGLLVTSGQLAAALTTGWLTLMAGLIGVTLLTRLGVRLEPLAMLTLAVALGFGALALGTLGLGLLGWLTAPVVWSLSIGLVGVLGVTSRRALTGWTREASAAWRALPTASLSALVWLALASLVALITWITTLAPDIGFDALMSHLALARLYSERGAVTGEPFVIASYWPLGGNMLFTLGYLLGGETAAKLFHLLAGGLTAGCVYLLGRHLDSRLTGVAAASIWHATPLVVWESGTAYLDLFLALYTGGALIFFARWLDRRAAWPEAAGIGLFLGFGFGVKPLAGLLAVGIGLAMLAVTLRRWRQDGRVDPWSIAIVTSVAGVMGGIWYARAWLLTGNPVFPFLNAIFRSPLWREENPTFYAGGGDPGRIAGALTVGIGLSLLALFLAITRRRWRGVGRRDPWSIVIVATTLCVAAGVWHVSTWPLASALALPVAAAGGQEASALTSLLLPWTLTYQTKRFAGVDGSLGLIFLVCAPLIPLLLPRARRAAGIASVTLIYCLLWALIARNVRYLLPALVGLSPLAGWSLVLLWRWWNERSRTASWLIPLYAAGCMVLMLPVALASYWYSPAGLPLAVVLGRVSRSDYLAAAVPSYQTFVYANAHLDENARIFAVAESFRYFSDAPVLTPSLSLQGDRILFAESEEALWTALAEAGITHIVVNHQWMPQNWDFLVHRSSFLNRHTTILFSAHGVALHQLRPPPWMDEE